MPWTRPCFSAPAALHTQALGHRDMPPPLYVPKCCITPEKRPEAGAEELEPCTVVMHDGRRIQGVPNGRRPYADDDPGQVQGSRYPCAQGSVDAERGSAPSLPETHECGPARAAPRPRRWPAAAPSTPPRPPGGPLRLRVSNIPFRPSVERRG